MRDGRDSLRRKRARKEPNVQPISYETASPEVRAVFDDIKATRKVADVNNFWKYLAHDPRMLRHVWESLKEMMGPGALDPLTKELIYVAVSVTNGCDYCMASHTAGARQKGASEEMIREVYAVTGLANMTNRLANAYGVPVDEAFK
ncbi:carboxymuconolactone decarboxylase family protein [Taklimakanibacter lacteus]|uniref:carboxymuconolactone decarboxylase family protein n=1 Tax=Taklimakanibacter lacteus TaxID=2268456 RepID=UPI000E662CEA